MHILLRFSDDHTTVSVSVLVGPRCSEEKSPELQKLWDQEYHASLAYQMIWDNEKALSLDHQNPSILDIVVYFPRATIASFPQVVIEWFNFGFKFVFKDHNGIGQWLWVDNLPLAPSGTWRHDFFADRGEMVPISLRSQRIIEALMQAYGDPSGLHVELGNLLEGSHDHWTIHIWLRINLKEDKPADRMFTTLKACGNASVLNLFHAICDTKARYGRFCVMPMNWERGELVRGTAYSYQNAAGSRSTIKQMGWPKEVWLWPCFPFDHLESNTGYWENDELIGFDLFTDNPGDTIGNFVGPSPPGKSNIPVTKKDTVAELLDLLEEGRGAMSGESNTEGGTLGSSTGSPDSEP